MIRFCVLTTPRSGSTWFMDLLNMQEGVRGFSEVFLRPSARVSDSFFEKRLGISTPFSDFPDHQGGWRPYRVWDYLKWLEGQASDSRAIGFKLMYNQLRRIPELWIYLSMRRYRIIHLVRRNVVDIVLSREFRRQHLRAAHSDKPIDGRLRAVLIPERFVAEVKRTDRYIRLTRGFLRRWPIASLELAYEDLCKEPGIHVRRVLGFLGVAAGAVRLDSPFQRIAAGERRERMANYDDVESHIRRAGYGRFLDSDAEAEKI